MKRRKIKEAGIGPFKKIKIDFLYNGQQVIHFAGSDVMLVVVPLPPHMIVGSSYEKYLGTSILL